MGAACFFQQLDGTFSKTTLPFGGSSISASLGDYDGDGWLDLLVADNTRNIVWHNVGHGNLTAVTNTTIVTRDAFVVTWEDYDGDGDLDLFVGNFDSPSQLYRNDGGGIFVPLSPIGSTPHSDHVVGAAWGDYDNDGFADLILARVPATFGGPPVPAALFHNNGDGTFSQVNTSPISVDLGDTAGVAWGDYDNDGWLDLIATDFLGRGNRLYHNNGDGTFTRSRSGSVVNDSGSSSSAAWGDYDHDGFVDLFIANGTNGGGQSNDFLYRNNAVAIANTNGWVLVRCVGTVSNRSAIGTKVRLYAKIAGRSFWQLREVSTGDGQSVNPLELHFGLADATNIDLIRVEWPSGIVQELRDAHPREIITVTEPTRLTMTTPGVLNVRSWPGQAFLLEASNNLLDWESVSPLTNLTGTLEFQDAKSPGAATRFYRVRAR